jgi:hypothetical protein
MSKKHWSPTSTMRHKGYSARIMEAPRLTGEGVHQLPPGVPLNVFPADAFESLPENWMKGPGVFIVPVKPDKGLWFDWRENSEANTAVVPTVKGCNPITGMQTSGFFLEKYETKCPKHGCDFLAERYCPECKYKWPDRNYISMSPSWWDGFRAEDGTVRQFFFSEDELRDIATHLIGKENTVPAFGFAFFSPKVQRPDFPPQRTIVGNFDPTVVWNHPVYNYFSPPGSINQISNSSSGQYGGGIITSHGTDIKLTKSANITKGLTIGSNALGFDGEAQIYCCSSSPIPCAASPCAGGDDADSIAKGSDSNDTKGLVMDALSMEPTKTDSEAQAHLLESLRSKRSRAKGMTKSAQRGGASIDHDEVREIQAQQKKAVKEVSIGAGAKIHQELNHDTYALDSWKEAPDSVMTIYFVFQEKFEELKAGGMRDLSDIKEGMLNAVPVG